VAGVALVAAQLQVAYHTEGMWLQEVAMPARVVVVLNEPDFAEQVSIAMRTNGYEALALWQQ